MRLALGGPGVCGEMLERNGSVACLLGERAWGQCLGAGLSRLARSGAWRLGVAAWFFVGACCREPCVSCFEAVALLPVLASRFGPVARRPREVLVGRSRALLFSLRSGGRRGKGETRCQTVGDRGGCAGRAPGASCTPLTDRTQSKPSAPPPLPSREGGEGAPARASAAVEPSPVASTGKRQGSSVGRGPAPSARYPVLRLNPPHPSPAWRCHWRSPAPAPSGRLAAPPGPGRPAWLAACLSPRPRCGRPAPARPA